MQLNISIQLDESDISLLELLGAILGEETVTSVIPTEPSVLQQVVDSGQITVEEVEVTSSPPIVEKESETLKAKEQEKEVVEKRVKREMKRLEKETPVLWDFLNNASNIINFSQYVRLEHHGITELSDFAKQDPRELLIIMGLHERHITLIEGVQMKATMLLRSMKGNADEVTPEVETVKAKKRKKPKKSKRAMKPLKPVKRPKWTAKMNTLKNLSGYVWTAFCAVRPNEQGVVLSTAVFEQTVSLIKNKHDFGNRTVINEEGIEKVISKLFGRIVEVMQSPDFLLGHSDDIPNGGVYIMKLTKRRWPALEALKTGA